MKQLKQADIEAMRELTSTVVISANDLKVILTDLLDVIDRIRSAVHTTEDARRTVLWLQEMLDAGSES